MQTMIRYEDVQQLQCDDFYEGQSQLELHNAIGLKLATIKLAHMSVAHEKIIQIQGGSTLEGFTADEERLFAMLQLQANKYLQSRGKTQLPLLHLSIRMLLPYESIRQESIEETQEKKDSIITASASKSKKKRKKAKVKQVTQFQSETNQPEPDVLQTAYNSYERNFLASSCGAKEKASIVSPMATPTSMSAIPDQTPTASIGVHRPWQALSVPITDIEPILSVISTEEQQLKLFDLCSVYERYIMSMRENFEAAMQAAHLKNFIASNEIEMLKDSLLKSSSYHKFGGS
jgi:hypothetical protein